MLYLQTCIWPPAEPRPFLQYTTGDVEVYKFSYAVFVFIYRIYAFMHMINISNDMMYALIGRWWYVFICRMYAFIHMIYVSSDMMHALICRIYVLSTGCMRLFSWHTSLMTWFTLPYAKNYVSSSELMR